MTEYEHNEIAVGLAEVREQVKALNQRFDQFERLIAAQLAPLTVWVDRQGNVCQDHETRLTKLEQFRLVVTWIGGAIWAVAMTAISVLVKRVFGGGL